MSRPRSFCEVKLTKLEFMKCCSGHVSPFYHPCMCNLTFLQAAIFPLGISLPFSLAMRIKVAMAFSVFPVSLSKRGLSGNHCAGKKVNMKVWPLLVFIFEGCILKKILTKQKQRNIAIGIVDRPSSHLQPRVGIIHSASRTSNTAPIAQNA